MNSATDHVFHVWINREADRLREWEQANPSGETTTETRRGKEVQVPVKPRTPDNLIDPHGKNLYDFKAAMQTLGWLKGAIGRERKKELPMVHQQCSHSEPEPLEENYLKCWLGKRLTECPILARVRETFAEQMQRDYYRDKITPEDIDNVQANVCIWHMLMGTERFVDWQEGAVQDVSDRMFWNRVYDNLSYQPPEGDCVSCEGTGEITGDNDEERTCPNCDGSGFEPREPDEDEP